MKHGAARKLTRAATMSLLVLTTTAGVASWDVLAASPAMAQATDSGTAAEGPGDGTTPAPSSPGKDGNPVTAIVGGLLGGGGTPAP